MTMLPLWVRLGWSRRRPRTLWIPVFLFWPLVIALLLPLFVIAEVVGLALGWRPRPLAVGMAFYRLLCELRGVRIAIAGGQTRIFITIR